MKNIVAVLTIHENELDKDKNETFRTAELSFASLARVWLFKKHLKKCLI